MRSFISLAFKPRTEWDPHALASSSRSIGSSTDDISPFAWVKAGNELALALMLNGQARCADDLLRAMIQRLGEWNRESGWGANLVFDSWINLAELRYRAGLDLEAVELRACYDFSAGRDGLYGDIRRESFPDLSGLSPEDLRAGMFLLFNRSHQILLRHYFGRSTSLAIAFASQACAEFPFLTKHACSAPREFMAYIGEYRLDDIVEVWQECDEATFEIASSTVFQLVRAGDLGFGGVFCHEILEVASERLDPLRAPVLIGLWRLVLSAASRDSRRVALDFDQVASLAIATSDRALYSRAAQIVNEASLVGPDVPPWPLERAGHDPLTAAHLDCFLSSHERVDISARALSCEG